MIRYLTFAEIIQLHHLLMQASGGLAGLWNKGLQSLKVTLQIVGNLLRFDWKSRWVVRERPLHLFAFLVGAFRETSTHHYRHTICAGDFSC